MVLIVLFLLAVSGAASGVLVWAFWFSWGTRWMGGALAVSVFTLGIALVVIAHRLLPHATYVKQRPLMPSPPEEVRAFGADFARDGTLSRRKIVWLGVGGAFTAFALAAIAPVRSLGPRPDRRLTHTAWGPGVRVVNGSGAPVRLQEVPVGGALTVFPEGDLQSPDGQAMLIRVADDVGASAAVPPHVPGCYVYSKVCTHVGCPVGQYLAQSHQLMCPCHQSIFEVLDDGHPTFGPAGRALPQLPIKLDEEGFVVATGDFPSPVGPSFWTLK
jgi:ubiquinol-cytochrome c reductase iron-sulfur subunit